jgi:membrane protein
MEAMAKKTPLVDFLSMVWRRFQADRCLQIASSLTFTTLLALVPIITVMLTLMSAFPFFSDMTGKTEKFFVKNMLPESVAAIATYTAQFTENAGKLTVVGIVFLFVTSIIVLMTIERALNEIWRVPRPRSVVQRVFIYWALLTVGPILVGGSLSLTSWVVGLSLGLVEEIPLAAMAVLNIVPVLLTGVACTLLYLTLPNRRVLLRDAALGGFLAAMGFECMKRGFAIYITQFATYKLVYGAFASLPIFLLWIYLSWVVVLAGAVVAAAAPEWRERASQGEPAPGAVFIDALYLLKLLWQAPRREEQPHPRATTRGNKAAGRPDRSTAR